MVGAFFWQVESDVKQANMLNPATSECPNNLLFVPVSFHSKVIHWAHTSVLSCHPGVKRTMFRIKQFLVASHEEGCT